MSKLIGVKILKRIELYSCKCAVHQLQCKPFHAIVCCTEILVLRTRTRFIIMIKYHTKYVIIHNCFFFFVVFFSPAKNYLLQLNGRCTFVDTCRFVGCVVSRHQTMSIDEQTTCHIVSIT